MMPFNLTAGISLLAKSFSVLSCSTSSSLARCTSVLPVSYLITSRGLTAQAGGPPKKPLNGFLRYLMQEKPTVVKDHPGIKTTEVIVKIAQQWRTLSEEQKRPFQDEAQHATAQFMVDKQRYLAQLSPAEVEQQAADKRLKRAKKENFRRKKEANSLGKPKRPRSSFNIFMSENFVEAQGDNVQVYIQLAEDDRIRYMNEMTSWEEHMLEIGRLDLLRERSRPKEKAPSKKKAAAAVAKKNTKSEEAGKTTTKVAKQQDGARLLELPTTTDTGL
ncbi:hypothetical protein CRUP_001630 [Coryphaenoides rupestris]|nr:hypothetical protein CRUP_001630 [Coryphaenoides rupestris]